MLLIAVLAVSAAAFLFLQDPDVSSSQSLAQSPTGAAVVPIRTLPSGLNTADANTPGIAFISPTPADGASRKNGSAIVNIALSNAPDLKTFVWNWNGADYSMYSDSQIIMMNFDNVAALGESSTIVVDAANKHNGTNAGATWTTDAVYGNALYFDGSDSVALGTTHWFTNKMAIAAWIKKDGTWGHILTKDNLLASGKRSWHFSAAWQLQAIVFSSSTAYTTVTSNAAVGDNKWHHVVMNYDGSKIELYIDGKFDNSVAHTGNVNPSTTTAYIGRCSYTTNPYYFIGTIDEVRVWNVSLSANQIDQLYRTNLKKYSAYDWTFSANESNLGVGSYTYGACAVDKTGYQNCTGTRTLNVNVQASLFIDAVSSHSLTNQSAIIDWSTSAPANGTIKYGTSAASLVSVAYNVSFSTDHESGIVGLTNNTIYYYNITSCDQVDNCNTTGPFSFTTTQNVDLVAPALYSQVATPTNDTNVLVTLYSEAANVTLEYGITSALGSTMRNMTYTTTHNILITGLTNNTLYYYNITICDAFTNCNTTGPYNVTTGQNVDNVAPVILSRVDSATNQSVSVNITLNEQANVSLAYGMTSALGSVVTVSSYLTSHNLHITGLTNATLYYYNLTVCDDFGNCDTVGPYSLATSANIVEITAPVYIPAQVNDTLSFNVTSGNLPNGTLVSVNTSVTVKNKADGRTKLGVIVNANGLGSNFADLSCNATATSTVVNLSGVSGLGATHSLYVPVDGALGVYVCPHALRQEEVSQLCANFSKFSHAEAIAGTSRTIAGSLVHVDIIGDDYVVSGLRGTGIATGLVTNLTIWDENDAGMPYGGFARIAGGLVVFYANFTNASNMPAAPTSGACVIDFANPSYDGYTSMVWNAGINLHTFTTSFGSANTYDWKVNCTGQSDNLEANDTITIGAAPPSTDVPEFGTWALLAALGLVAAGVASMRGKARGTRHGRR